MFGYIYMTKNHINNKIYIGKKHSDYFVPNYYGSGLLIKRSIEKYGIDNFSVEIIDTANTLDELNEKEKYYINYHNVYYRMGEGYNIASGGDGGNLISGWSEERYQKHIENCSVRNSGKLNPNYGNGHKIAGDKNPSKRAEVRKKLSIANKGKNNAMYNIDKNHPMYGRKHTKETREKISKSLSGEKHPHFGIPKSEETKKKIGEAQKGKIISEESKKKMSEAGKNLSDKSRKNISEAAKLRRYKCTCKICKNIFIGKAWNASKCEACKIKK